MAKPPLSTGQHDFVEDMGQLMASWGLPRNTGRLYAYLMLRDGAVSLDQITSELRIAKSGASVGARQLVGFGLARAVGERGSRRVRYEALYNPEPMFAARRRQFEAFQAVLRDGVRVARAGAPKQQMQAMGAVMAELEGELAGVIARMTRGRLRAVGR